MRILMVSTEYPPMIGGVGRYTANLVAALKKRGMEVFVVCDKSGNGDFFGLSPKNAQNSETLLETADKVHPDIIHVQFEPGMYGLVIDSINPAKTITHIDSFYKKSGYPIVTTFHTLYDFRQWTSQGTHIKKTGKTKQLGIPLRYLIRLWKYSLSYRTFQNQNKEKLALSKGGIVFSQYASKLIGGGAKVIYHGAEPALATTPSKTEARKSFSLPGGEEGGGGGEGEHTRIALALGYKTSNKGWDILGKIRLPQGWKIVINSSKSHYNTESYRMDEMLRTNKSIIDIQRGFLSEEELSALFYSADAVLLPYKVTAGSGVMFDALAHGVPFVASDLGFFREFSALGLGITAKREPGDFSNAIKRLDRDYDDYVKRVAEFKQKLSWDSVARQHQSVYTATAAAAAA
jgi:glycosyltransferase involved in cell wall biosynthesis